MFGVRYGWLWVKPAAHSKCQTPPRLGYYPAGLYIYTGNQWSVAADSYPMNSRMDVEFSDDQAFGLRHGSLNITDGDGMGKFTITKKNTMKMFGKLIKWEWAHSRWFYTTVLKSMVTRLFVQQLVQANKKENFEAMDYWPFVKGIHRWPVASPPKGPEV